jgi:hypothetical protein
VFYSYPEGRITPRSATRLATRTTCDGRDAASVSRNQIALVEAFMQASDQEIGVECGRGQNDTLRKLLLGVPVEPIGFFHQ